MLEYRGYDSAGLSLLVDGRIDSVRAVGHLAELNDAVAQRTNGDGREEFESTTGIAHTRWATHGAVTEDNAHPHFDTKDRVHIVLNGIVENHTQLRKELLEAGAEFTSDTDAEVVAHLIAHEYEGDLVEAVRTAYNKLRGHYAFVAMTADEPGVLVGARKECPLVVGVGEGEQFLASAIPAFLRETRNVKLVNDGEIVAIRPDGVQFLDASGAALERETTEVDWDADTAEKGGYDTFMLKEIHEQPDAVAETISDRTPGDHVELAELSDELLAGVRRIVRLRSPPRRPRRRFEGDAAVVSPARGCR